MSHLKKADYDNIKVENILKLKYRPLKLPETMSLLRMCPLVTAIVYRLPFLTTLCIKE